MDVLIADRCCSVLIADEPPLEHKGCSYVSFACHVMSRSVVLSTHLTVSIATASGGSELGHPA